MDQFDEQTNIWRLAEQHGIDRRWLRRMALRLIAEIAPTCADSDEARSNWVAALQRAVTGLGLSYGEGVTVTSYFRRPPNAEWAQFLQPRADLATIAWATIHEAKGSQHNGVCVVIPTQLFLTHLGH